MGLLRFEIDADLCVDERFCKLVSDVKTHWRMALCVSLERASYYPASWLCMYSMLREAKAVRIGAVETVTNES